MSYVTDGLVAYYRGASGSGSQTTLNDESGNGKNMTLTGFTFDGTTNGWTGSALRFNGSTTYTKTSATDITANCIEICCTFHELPSSYANLMVTIPTAGGSGLAIYERAYATTGITGNYYATSLTNVYSTIVPTLEQLCHVVLQYTGSQMEIWVDNVLKATKPTTTTVIDPSHIILGANQASTPTYFTNMSVKLARAYNRSLTSTEIGQNYNNAISAQLTAPVLTATENTGFIRLSWT